jgi:protocatechuate 3,4-dioxygenase alpha subunit
MPSATASQTVGPFWHLIEHAEMADLTRFGATGEKVTITGRITDGDGAPVTDALVEIWQADPPISENFPGFGRAGTNMDRNFSFITVKPGPVAGRGNALQAPHLALTIMARGLLKGLLTRLYFAGDPLNQTDPLLNLIEDPSRRATLIAHPAAPGTWHLDIRLQGANETVFLDI